MTWFDHHAGADPAAFYARLAAAVASSGIQAAVDTASGAVGLRRFVVRAEVHDGRVRLVQVDGPPLPRGGGPPSAAAWAANQGVVEAALARLRRTLPREVDFTELALGVVRHATGPVELSFRFDGDAAGFGPGNLPMPVGPPAPIEDPAWLRSQAAWAARVDELRARFAVARGDWALVGGLLDDGQRRVAATPLASWHAGQRRFEWLVAEPVGEEAPLVEPELTVDLAGAIDLVCYAAARIGAAGVFQGALPTGVVVFLATR